MLVFPQALNLLRLIYFSMNKLVLGLVLLVLITSGCLDSDTDYPEEFEQADVGVLVGEMHFQQEGMEADEIEAALGDEIVFYNEGSVEHTVTIPELDVDEIIEPEETVKVEASEELDDALVDCTLHGGHDAELTVE